MGEAIRLAELMASAKLVPAALQKSPADCLMVIQQAIRWQMDPFAVAQECSAIQGKLMYGGKLVAAVVNTRGNLTSRLSFEYSGEGDNRTITVSGQLQGEAEPRVVQVVLKNARTQNRVWQTQPDQQLAYHGARVWARRHTPELMLGVYSPEEFDEPARRVAIANPDTYKEDLRRDLNAHPIEKAEPTDDLLSSDDYVERWEMRLADANSAADLAMLWNSERALRNNIAWPDRMTHSRLLEAVTQRIEDLKQDEADKPGLATQRLKAEDT
jgi:hypothetical protein